MTVLQIGTVQEHSYPPISIERTDSTGKNCSAAQRKHPEILRTQEPKSSLGQKSSVFRSHPELIGGHRATYPKATTREWDSQEYLHTCVHRELVSHEQIQRLV